MKSGDNISQLCDCVVILDWPDDKSTASLSSESIAKQFGLQLPVIVVNPSLENGLAFVDTDPGPVSHLYISKEFNRQQTKDLNQAILSKGFIKPLLWVANPAFIDFVFNRHCPVKVYAPPVGLLSKIQTAQESSALLSLVDLVILPDEDWIADFLPDTSRLPDFYIWTPEDAFEALLEKLSKVKLVEPDSQQKLNVLILYDQHSTYTATVFEHTNSFRLFSRNNVAYSIASNQATCNFDISEFDAVVIHYSIRICLGWHLNSSFAEEITRFGGLKVLYIQDEYEYTETARSWMEKLGIQVVFTVVPEKYVGDVYPETRFPYVEFINTLTGFVPNQLPNLSHLKPTAQRKRLIGYRGRPLHYCLGDLAQEKMIVGQRMKEICDDRKLPIDIAWTEQDRIYGSEWYKFIADSRATLGTESGANVFDEDGSLRKQIDEALKKEPLLSYETIHQRYVGEREGRILMNQISPRIFEAIAHKTALVLFEGDYSGAIRPNEHYVPLKKDFSNVDDVINKLTDNEYLQAMVDRAYRDIIVSGRYSYIGFIRQFDEALLRNIRRAKKAHFLIGIIAREIPSHLPVEGRFAYHPSSPTSEPLVSTSLTRTEILAAPQVVVVQEIRDSDNNSEVKFLPVTDDMVRSVIQNYTGVRLNEILHLFRLWAGIRLRKRPALHRLTRSLYYLVRPVWRLFYRLIGYRLLGA